MSDRWELHHTQALYAPGVQKSRVLHIIGQDAMDSQKVRPQIRRETGLVSQKNELASLQQCVVNTNQL